jgi:hypothetical protein
VLKLVPAEDVRVLEKEIHVLNKIKRVNTVSEINSETSETGERASGGIP